MVKPQRTVFDSAEYFLNKELSEKAQKIFEDALDEQIKAYDRIQKQMNPNERTVRCFHPGVRLCRLLPESQRS